MKNFEKKKGFTFVEIIISIAIVAILIAVAIPAYKAIKTSAERTAHNANVDQISSVALLYFTDFPKEKKVTSDQLFSEGYLKSKVTVPSSIPVTSENTSRIYTVTHDDKGVITVSPDKVEAKKSSETGTGTGTGN